MKNIILQHFTGPLRELEERSVDNIQKYASRIGVEYKFIDGQVFRPHLTAPCQKVFMLDVSFDEYDTVLMLDIDMFTPANMNIDIFNEPGIGLHVGVQGNLHRRIVRDWPTISSHSIPYWGGAIYKMDRKTRQTLRSKLGGNESWMDGYNKAYNFEDEGIMHTLATKSNFQPTQPYLEQKWCQCSFLPNPEKAGIIHMRTKTTPSGPKREKLENYHGLVNVGVLEK